MMPHNQDEPLPAKNGPQLHAKPFAGKNDMNKVFNPNKTSAKLLVDYAHAQWQNAEHAQNAKDKEGLSQRYLMMYDLYIKARSYAIINKVAFWCAVIAGAMVLLWPSLAIVLKDFGWEKELFKSAVVQTTVTGLAALTFAIYSHYKKRQQSIENLMRHALFSDDSLPHLMEMIILEMDRIDTGFSFSQAIYKKTEVQEKKES